MLIMLIITMLCLTTACVKVEIEKDGDKDIEIEQNDDDIAAAKSEPAIDREQAISIVLERAGSATEEDIVEIECEFDDGCWKYEGEVMLDSRCFDFEIDGENGNILEWEIDD